MVALRSASTRAIEIEAEPDAVHKLLADVVGCGRLMPGVESLTAESDGTYHYVLTTISNGAVSHTPDYRSRFDTSDPAHITWGPADEGGTDNFRSWGTFRTEPGTSPGTTRLEIETRSEADVDIAPVVLPLVEPFAKQQSEEITEGFLQAIKERVE
ncbi:SRPBCC family protein [Streptomyces sp. NPDC048172]|uniref:SRPBCC family protein n=1 Tax=Streptomyces sp. NPDC048172 TaxID=3365505 RepID=UPI00371916D9